MLTLNGWLAPLWRGFARLPAVRPSSPPVVTTSPNRQAAVSRGWDDARNGVFDPPSQVGPLWDGYMEGHDEHHSSRAW